MHVLVKLNSKKEKSFRGTVNHLLECHFYRNFVTGAHKSRPGNLQFFLTYKICINSEFMSVVIRYENWHKYSLPLVNDQ